MSSNSQQAAVSVPQIIFLYQLVEGVADKSFGERSPALTLACFTRPTPRRSALVHLACSRVLYVFMRVWLSWRPSIYSLYKAAC